MIRRGLFRALSMVPFGVSAGALVWTMTLSPFTAPLVDRSAEEIGRAIDRALAHQVTPDWLRAEMEVALDAGDWDRVQTLALIGADVGLAPAADLMERIAALEAEETGWIASAGNCLTCMTDVAACPSLATLAACGIPFEMTPLGDLNELRRQGLRYVQGEEVDTLNTTLAIVGVGATVLVIGTGGTSYTAKAGASLIRVGRRLGTITAPFLRVLRDLGDVGLKMDKVFPYALGRVPLAAVVDVAKLARLEDLGRDLSRVHHNTDSMADSVRLLGHMDSADDARRVARASDVLGPRTGRTFDILGKGRVFRAMVRLSDLALGAVALIAAVLLQLAAFIGHMLGRGLILRPLGRWAARQAKT